MGAVVPREFHKGNGFRMVGDVQREIDERVAAANDVAQTARTLTLGFMLVALTMAALVVGTADQAILRDSAEIAPTLGVRVSVSLAHVFAPIIFLFLHVDVLIRFDLLGQRIAALNDALSRLPLGSERSRHRQRIHGFTFAQVLAGGYEGRGSYGLLLLLVWAYYFLMPLFLLLAIQVGFVRYQSTAITHLHQIVLIGDIIVLIWFQLRLWRRIGAGRIAWRAAANWTVALLISVVSLAYANPPDPNDDPFNVRWTQSETYNNEVESSWAKHFLPVLHGQNALDVLLCPHLDWGCRYLRLSGLTLIRDDALLKAVEPIVSDQSEALEIRLRTLALFLRDRSLRFADLRESLLYGVDLIGADLRGATLDHAHLSRARMNGALLAEASLSEARLQGAVLDGADLKNANLLRAQLKDASLFEAQLQGAILSRANLQWAILKGARMQRASLTDAQLQGAQLIASDMRGCRLEGAHLQGAILDIVMLQGANLARAQLDGASLNNIDLAGATLRDASLQGAVFNSVNLAGARMVGANMQGARLENVNYRLADFRDIATGTWRASDAKGILEELNRASHDEFGRLIKDFEYALRRVEARDQQSTEFQTLPAPDDAVLHSGLKGWPAPPPAIAYSVRLAMVLTGIACADEHAASGVLDRLVFSVEGQVIGSDKLALRYPSYESFVAGYAIRHFSEAKANSKRCPGLARADLSRLQESFAAARAKGLVPANHTF